jgi:anhydro-N-acetylmuramic acid kinase
VAFDVAPANRVLNALAGDAGLAYDKDGLLAAAGEVDEELLGRLNALPYYGMGYPKSLANEFGLEEVLPLVRAAGLSTADALRTYVEHIAEQVERAVEGLGFSRGGAGSDVAGRAGGVGGEGTSVGRSAGDGGGEGIAGSAGSPVRMLVTGGGAHNAFLVARLRARLAELGVEVVVPDAAIVDYKEALVMALIGVLRWREENNVLASVTGASRDSIGGAVWIGQEV